MARQAQANGGGVSQMQLLQMNQAKLQQEQANHVNTYLQLQHLGCRSPVACF